MAKQKQPVHWVYMTEGKRNIIYQLLKECNIQCECRNEYFPCTPL